MKPKGRPGLTVNIKVRLLILSQCEEVPQARGPRKGWHLVNTCTWASLFCNLVDTAGRICVKKLRSATHHYLNSVKIIKIQTYYFHKNFKANKCLVWRTFGLTLDKYNYSSVGEKKFYWMVMMNEGRVL